MERWHCRAPAFGANILTASFLLIVFSFPLLIPKAVAQESTAANGAYDAGNDAGGASGMANPDLSNQSSQPTSSTDLVRQGMRAHSAGNDELAAELFGRATELNPNDSNALFNLGTIYETRGQLDRALETFQHVSQIDPADSSAQQEIDRVQAAMSKAAGPDKLFQLHGSQSNELAQPRPQHNPPPPLANENPQASPNSNPQNPRGNPPVADNPQKGPHKTFHLHGVHVPWSAVAMAAVVGGSATAIVAVSKIHSGGSKSKVLPIGVPMLGQASNPLFNGGSGATSLLGGALSHGMLGGSNHGIMGSVGHGLGGGIAHGLTGGGKLGGGFHH